MRVSLTLPRSAGGLVSKVASREVDLAIGACRRSHARDCTWHMNANVRTAKARLSELLDRAAAGEEIIRVPAPT